MPNEPVPMKTTTLFKNFEIGHSVSTNGTYKFFPAPQGVIQFEVKAAHDAHIALTTELQESGPMYEIILGKNNNSRVVIRKNRRDKVVTEVGSIGDKEYARYWISRENNIISFGGAGYNLPIIAWSDPEPLRIFFIGVCTRNGATGSWKFEDVKTPSSAPYQFFPVSNGELTFKVQAAHDAQIALTTKPEESKSMVEVILGCKENTECTIKKKGSVLGKAVKTIDILKADKFQTFRIKWNVCGYSVYHEEIDKPFIPLTYDPEPYPIFYFGIRTDYGAVGTWKCNAVPARPQSGPFVTTPSIWVEASYGQIPYGAVEGGQESSKELVYVARIKEGDATYPGKLIASEAATFVSKDGKEHSSNYYEVLVTKSFENWIVTKGTEIPAAALIAGRTADGEPLYVGRVYANNRYNLGWVKPSTGLCHYTWKGKEVTSVRYEVLMN